MTLTTKRRLITGSLLGVAVFTGAVAGWVGGVALLGFWLGWCSALLAAIGSHIRLDMLEQEAHAAWMDDAKIKLGNAREQLAVIRSQLNN